MKKINLYILSLILCLLITVFIINLKESEDTVDISNDYYMYIDDFKLVKNEKDKIIWTLESRTANMLNNKNKIEFLNVKVLVNSEKEKYVIKSNKGTYRLKKEIIELIDNVTIDFSNLYKISTNYVKYFTKNEEIKTKDFIEVKGFNQDTNEKISIHGNGLEGNVKKGIFNILNNVYSNIENTIDVISNYAKLDVEKNKVLFTDNVVAKKMDLTIDSNNLLVSYNAIGEIDSLEAYGDVKLRIGDKKAICDNAVISNKDSKISMFGRPELYMDDDIIVGERIDFYTDSDEVMVSKVKAEVKGE